MSDMNDDPMKTVWRSQPTEVPAMSVSYLRHRAGELDKSFRLRSRLEQAACLLGMILCVGIVLLEQELWQKVGAALLLVGILFGFVQWRRRTAANAAPAFESAAAGLVFYKRELERKRDIHRTLWRWYLLPIFIPAAAFLALAMIFSDLQTKLPPWILLVIMAVSMIFAVVYENTKAAQYQREIDALASLDKEAAR